MALVSSTFGARHALFKLGRWKVMTAKSTGKDVPKFAVNVFPWSCQTWTGSRSRIAIKLGMSPWLHSWDYYLRVIFSSQLNWSSHSLARPLPPSLRPSVRQPVTRLLAQYSRSQYEPQTSIRNQQSAIQLWREPIKTMKTSLCKTPILLMVRLVLFQLLKQLEAHDDDHVRVSYTHPGVSRDHHFNILRPRQNGLHFADDIHKHILLNKIVWISISQFHWSLFFRVQLTIGYHSRMTLYTT